MNFLNHIWKDIGRGENIDLYVTVLIALVLVILNIIGFAPSNWMAPLTLAVLGLLAISNLGSRYKLEQFINNFNRSAESFFQDEYPSNILDLIKSSSEIWFIGVTLNRTIKNYFHILEQKLQRGDFIKVLLVNPDSPAADAARSRGRFEINHEQMKSNILDTLTELGYLKSIAPNRIEVRTISYPISFGAILLNPDDSELTSGIIFIEHYPYRIKRTHVPKFVLSAKQDAEWFNLYKSELCSMWSDGVDWNFEEKDKI